MSSLRYLACASVANIYVVEHGGPGLLLQLSVLRFQTHADRGPEKLFEDGVFSYNLIKRAPMITDAGDSVICPSGTSGSNAAPAQPSQFLPATSSASFPVTYRFSMSWTFVIALSVSLIVFSVVVSPFEQD